MNLEPRLDKKSRSAGRNRNKKEEERKEANDTEYIFPNLFPDFWFPKIRYKCRRSAINNADFPR